MVNTRVKNSLAVRESCTRNKDASRRIIRGIEVAQLTT